MVVTDTPPTSSASPSHDPSASGRFEDSVIPPGSVAALYVLVAMVVLSPWALGGAPVWARKALTLIALGASVAVLALQARRGIVHLPARPLWPLFALVILGVLQLAPVPGALHGLIAPGSFTLWHPDVPAAAGILGARPRPISVHPAATRDAITWWLGLLSLTSLAAPALQERHRRRRVVATVVVGVLAVAVYGVVARVVFGPLLYGRWPVPTITPFGPFVSKNHFAGFVGMGAMLALGLGTSLADSGKMGAGALSWVAGPKASQAFLAFGASAGLALSVLVSQSRGGALALAAGAVAFLTWRATRSESHSSRRRVLGYGAGGVVLAVLLLAALPGATRQRLAGIFGAPDAAGSYRFGIWADTLRAFRANPLVGQGMGAFEDALPRWKTTAGALRVHHAENDYLELLVEGGAAAALLGGAAFFLIARLAWQRLRRHRGRASRGELAGATAALVVVLVHSFFDFDLRLPASASLAAFLGALLVAHDPSPVVDRGRTVGLVACGTLGAAFILAALSRPPSSTAALDAVTAARGARGPGPARLLLADVELVDHLRRRPSDAEGWSVLGWLRAARGQRDEGVVLARYGASLDPTRKELAAYSEALSRSTVR